MPMPLTDRTLVLAVRCWPQFFNPNGLPLPHVTYVGHTLLTGATSSAALAEEALRLSGLPPNTRIDLYEQVSDAPASQPASQPQVGQSVSRPVFSSLFCWPCCCV